MCFIGAAHGDADAGRLRFYAGFSQFDCKPTHLPLFARTPRDLESFVLEHDGIYVGGGNTRSLLAVWREWQLDVYLRKAYERGIVLGGASAGSICWFEQGVTDSIAGPLTALDCLGFLPCSNCPHYDSEVLRRPTYRKLGITTYGFSPFRVPRPEIQRGMHGNDERLSVDNVGYGTRFLYDILRYVQ